METRNQDKQISQQTSEIVVISETGAASKSSASPSPNSSPSHEFSFTISLHSSQTTAASSDPTLRSSKTTKIQQPNPPLAIDLSPADDIFFHGHLLPLHFLSHLHASSSSPRTSTATSLDNILHQSSYGEIKPVKNNLTEVDNHASEVKDSSCNCQKPPNNKSSAFSLTGFVKWVKGPETKEKSDRIKKLKFDVGQFLKKYIKMAKPLVSPKERRREKHQQQQQRQQHEQEERKCYSYSGSLSPKIQRRELRDLRGEYSAPASMRTSPTNSGILAAKTSDVSVNHNNSVHVSDSTMDELHAAIQSAIAHCKNSISSTSHVKSQGLF